MATVRECPLCPPEANLWDRSVEQHHGQWLGNATPRTVADRDYERDCAWCDAGPHDLSVRECNGHSLLDVPMRRRRRRRIVLLDLPWATEQVRQDMIIGRGLGCPFGDRFADHEAGRYVGREHVSILFRDGNPILRVERSANSTLLDEIVRSRGDEIPLTDGMVLRLSTRFPPVRIQVQEAD